MIESEIRQAIVDALTRATLRNNPIYPPDPRGLILYRLLVGADADALVGVLFDEASQILLQGEPIVSLADTAAKEAGIAPRWGSGRRRARDGGGYPGYYLGRVRYYIHVYYHRPEVRYQGLRLVADFWAGRILDAARAHGYTQDPETHLWVPPPKK